MALAPAHRSPARTAERCGGSRRAQAAFPGSAHAALRALACLFLAFTLVVGYVPLAVLAGGQAQLAFAADGEDDAGEGGAGGPDAPDAPDDGGQASDPDPADKPSSGGGDSGDGGSGDSGSGGAAGGSGDSGGGSQGQDDPDATDPDPSDPGTDPSDPSGLGTDPEDPAGPADRETYYVRTLLLKWDEPDSYGVTHFVGDSAIVERAYEKVKISDYGKTVQLRGWYLSTDGTGVAYQTADSASSIGAFDLRWESSDEAVATVSPDGLVTPHGKNGSVTITATVDDENVYQGSAPAATVTIVFDGQEGKYVKSVEILNEEGSNIGEKWGGVTVYTDENAFHQLQARVTWVNVADKSETVEVTGSGEEYKASKVGTTITWNISATNAFSINEDTGRLRTTTYSGNAYVTCSVVGGLGGKVVQDTANVQLDTGVYEYNPAESLTLRVVWEERPDEVVKEQVFTLDELASKLSSRHANATVVNNSRFGVISAEGYLFKDVVGLVAVDDADVLQYRFGTADGYDNPVSYQYLFNSGNRYYFPNYDIGSTAEGQISSPLLAYKSRFLWGQSEADPTWELDEGTRFRLVFGCLASGDANTSYQIYYIHTITIVLSGGPSAGGGGGDGVSDRKTGAGSGGKQDGTGGTGHGKTGAGSGTTGTGGANGSGTLEGNDGDGKEKAGAEATAGDGDEATEGEDAEQADEASGTDVGASKRWRVYQMMNKNNSDVPDWDDENPISPFAAPLALGTFAIGAGVTGIGFRRRLM